MKDDLHPEVRDLLGELRELDILPAFAQSPAGARCDSHTLFTEWESGVPERDVDTQALSIEGPKGELPVRAYLPGGSGGAPVLVHIHGGGWVRGELDAYDEFCKQLTDELGCLTLSVDYRRAPEHPFPAAAEDSYAVIAWAAEHADLLGGDPDRLAVVGDSAGGNLAAAVALMARDREGPALEHQVLVYPALNYAFDTDSYETNADDPILPRESMEWYWNHYIERDVDRAHPYASPLRARSLAELPPATVITAGHDPLRDEGLAYAERLSEAGVTVSTHNRETVMHGFNLFPELSVTQDVRASIIGDLRDAFG